MESYITFAYLGNKLRLINKYSLTRYVSGIFWLHSDFPVECSMLCNKSFYRWHRHSGRKRQWSAHKTIFRSLVFWKIAFSVKNKELSTFKFLFDYLIRNETYRVIFLLKSNQMKFRSSFNYCTRLLQTGFAQKEILLLPCDVNNLRGQAFLLIAHV